MTDIACLVRQSQGNDQSISLEKQRAETTALAAELGDDDPEMIDLGTFTGFSSFVKTEEQDRLDANPRIQDLRSGLQKGRWDYLVAYDDTRVARDQFFWVLKHAAQQGDVETAYVADTPDDRLTFRVQRAVEAEVKRKEIEKVRQAVQHRIDEGMYQGTPPYGLTHDENGEYLVKDPNEWPDVVTVFEGLADDAMTYQDIVAECEGIASASTVTRIKGRRETYEEFADGELP